MQLTFKAAAIKTKVDVPPGKAVTTAVPDPEEAAPPVKSTPQMRTPPVLSACNLIIAQGSNKVREGSILSQGQHHMNNYSLSNNKVTLPV